MNTINIFGQKQISVGSMYYHFLPMLVDFQRKTYGKTIIF